jgi:hypothetical protein
VVQIRVLDLFSGLGGFSEPFRERGHEVVTLDIDARFEPDIVADVRTIRYPSLPPLDRPFDVVLASPPCEAFSLAASWNGWPPPPEKTERGLSLVASALLLIADIAPLWWVMENPHGRLALDFLPPPRETVYLCSYGAKWKKPTDLWGRYPGKLRLPCAPHEPATLGDTERGVTAGYGGLWATRDPALRAKLPHGLGEELCRRMEEAL